MSYRPETGHGCILDSMLAALPLPSSDLGTHLTMATMRFMATRDAMMPMVRLTASGIVAGLGGKDGFEQAQAIREYVAQHTEFLRDPDMVEMLHSPVWQLRQIQQRGLVQVDCDDVAMLAAALGKSIGLRARFVAVAFDGINAPFRHIWAELSPRMVNAWVDVDTTRPAQALDFPRVSRAIVKDV